MVNHDVSSHSEKQTTCVVFLPDSEEVAKWFRLYNHAEP